MQSNAREKVELFIVILIVVVYAYLVLVGITSPDGFIALAVYVVKKFLDFKEDNSKIGGDKNEEKTS